MITLVHEVQNKRAKVLAYFLTNPTTRVHLRALSRELDISLPWTIKVTNELAKAELIQKVKRGVEVEVFANKDTDQFKTLKRSYTLYLLTETGLVSSINEAFGNPPTIVLFGSAAHGEDTETSDIDIAVITQKSLNLNLTTYEKKLHRKIKLTILPPRKIEKEFLNTLANGITLEGYLEVA